MLFRKVLLLVLILMLFVSVGLTGCGQQTSTDQLSQKDVSDNNERTSTDDDIKADEDDKNNSEREMIGNMYKTGLPIVKEKVTIRIAAYKNPMHSKEFNDMIVVKNFEEKTNVHIEWEAIPQSAWSEKKSLMFASGDLPDAFFPSLNTSEEINYGGQGMLISLNQLIDEWAPNIKMALEKRPDIKKACTTPDGNIYAIPAIEEQIFMVCPDNFFINKTWLDRLSLSIPQTTDDFYQVLKAFKENDPNESGNMDEIPFSFMFANRNSGIYSLFGSFGMLDNPQHIVMKNNEVVFTADKPQHKEALKYFHMLYKEGLIDPEAFTQDSKQYTAKGHNDPIVLGAFIDWSYENVCGTEPAYSNYAIQPPLKGPDGHMMWNKYNGGFSKGGFAITSTNIYPEITMRWVNEIYEPENSLEWSFPPFGYNLKKNSDGTYEYIDTPPDKAYGEFRHSETIGAAAPKGLLSEIFDKLTPMDEVKAKTERYYVYKPYFPEQIYPLVYFTDEQEQRLSTIRTDIEQYIKKMQAKWIIDGGIENEWDSYVEQLNKMGLKELINIYQEAFDIFNKQ